MRSYFFHLCLSVICASFFDHGNIGKHSLEGSLIVSVSICVPLIMNHGTILEQNCRGSTREMVITVSVCVCLIINHGTIVQQNSRGSAHDEFCHFCSRCLIMNKL